MTPTERLQAAIDRLTEQRDTATEGPWEADGDGKVWAHPVGPDGARTTHLDDVCDPQSLNDADLIVTLHRTIDKQLTILRSALGDADGSHDEPGAFDLAVTLADAILGAAS